MQALASSGSSKMLWPLTTTSPSVALRYPVMMFIVVDFPAPLGPRKPYTLPISKVRFK